MLVAPATANTIAKLANGIADNMVTTTLLATTADVWIAPAMNVHMYDHPAVKRNIEQLSKDGYSFIEPSEGFLACGYVGKGRLEEPEKIVELVETHFSPKDLPLKGKKVVVTAGPTREKLDPVRFLTNFSSGKMGYAMAEAASKLGAETILISGPVAIDAPQNVKLVNVESTEDMFLAVLNHFETASIVVKTAAVADYKAKEIHPQKMKKKEGEVTIALEKTTDILSELGKRKTSQILVGFAAETNDVVHYAKGKLKKKNADYIIANDVTEEGSGFGTETNAVTLVGKNDIDIHFPQTSKKELALQLFRMIIELEKDETL